MKYIKFTGPVDFPPGSSAKIMFEIQNPKRNRSISPSNFVGELPNILF